MIYYNSNTINDWNFGDDNIIKVYRNGAVVFYKFDSEQGGYKVCYAVVDDITQYSETEFEDVFDKTTEKWYKLNNLNQYEEYGIYGSGRTICEGSASRLPVGYTEVEYVENTSTAYLDIAFKPNTNTRIIADMQQVTANDYPRLFGCNKWNDTAGMNVNYEGGYLQICWFGKTSWTQITSVPNNFDRHIYDLNKNNLYVDEILVASTTYSSSYQSSDNLGIFIEMIGGRPSSSNYWSQEAFKGKMYSFKVYDNGTLVRDLVPCIKDSDNSVGAYDIVNDVFYTVPTGYTTDKLIAGGPAIPTDCVTTYEGKLTIDDGYEYEWNGSSWVNLGEVSGSSRVPDGYTELTYCTVPKQSTEKFVVPYELQPYYKYSMEFTPLDFWTSSYYAVLCADYSSSNNLQLFKLDNGWGTQWRRFENKFENYVFDTRGGKPFQDKYTVFENVKAKISFNLSGYTIGQGAVITVENEGSSAYTGVSTTTASSSYNPTYGIRTMYMMCGEDNQYGKTANMKFHNFKIETSGGTAIYDYIPTKRDSDNKVGIYDVVHNVFHAPLFKLNAGDEASHTTYPKYYSEKSEPLDNLTFNTMEEADDYAYNNCVYVGFKATINGDKYVFSGDSQSGYEWVYQPPIACEYNFCGVDANGNDVIINNGTTTLAQSNWWSSPYPVDGIVGNATTTIGQYCFNDISGTLTALTIGNTITTIEHEAFMETSLLTTLTIPSSVTQIDFWAFTRCNGLQEVIFKGTTPPTFTNQHSGVFHDYCPPVIYVPDSAVSAYRAIDGSVWTSETWSTNIIQPISNRT